MAELEQIEIVLGLPEGMQLHSSMGSVFHGLLMDVVGDNVAQWLHSRSHNRPFSQCVYYDRNRRLPIWRVSTLTEEAGGLILDALRDLMGFSFRIKQKNLNIELCEVAGEKRLSYQELMDRAFLTDELLRGGRLDFITPAGFKRDGYYVSLPEMYLIFQSLLQRWNSFYQDAAIISDGLERELGAMCHIGRYELKSKKFSVNSGTVYGFCGNMDVRFSGQDMARRIMGLLMSYAPFAGIGIKTALGMGAVDYSWKIPAAPCGIRDGEG